MSGAPMDHFQTMMNTVHPVAVKYKVLTIRNVLIWMNGLLKMTSANDLTVKVLNNFVKSWVLNTKFIPVNQTSGIIVFLMARKILVPMAVAPKN